ncbi:MAG: hypothetical protein ACRC3B_04760, partial [Bacteroidia bacterium]
VLPMVPKAKNWKLNGFAFRLVCRFTGQKACIARGPFATALALRARKKGVLSKVVFDARGAYIAELQEYNVIPDEAVKREIPAIERDCVLQSDKRLAVSEALVNYWREKFDYTGNAHRVIPCTLNSSTTFAPITETAVAEARTKLDIPADACVIVYSGSAAGWQSLDDFGARMLPLLEADEKLHLLLLIKNMPGTFEPLKVFPKRVHQRWLAPEEVGNALTAADWGWMLREDSVTNRVASPVKFAEYLAAGLQVIISDNLGDTTEFVRKHHCGIAAGNETLPAPAPLHIETRKNMQELARLHFTKETYIAAYTDLLA